MKRERVDEEGEGRVNEKRKRDEQTDRSTQRTNSRRLPVAQYNIFMYERKEMGCVACNYKRESVLIAKGAIEREININICT
jgi:hypothetical protein